MVSSLPKATLAIIETVREKTGKGIKIETVPNLPVGLAKTKIAREGMDFHTIFLGESYTSLAGYLVAHECGHILRFFAAPESERKVPISNERTRRIAFAQIQKELSVLKAMIPPAALTELVEMWYHGLTHQLTSQPADIMIERWLHSEYPDLRDLQRKALDLIHKQTIPALDSKVAKMTPRTIYIASMAANYAFFKALDTFLGTHYAQPFEKEPFVATGKRLLEVLDIASGDSLVEDIRIANSWAYVLGITGWFEWIPYKSVSMTEQ